MERLKTMPESVAKAFDALHAETRNFEKSCCLFVHRLVTEDDVMSHVEKCLEAAINIDKAFNALSAEEKVKLVAEAQLNVSQESTQKTVN